MTDLRFRVMEKELSVATILKDKPRGIQLFDLLHNVKVKLDKIESVENNNQETIIWCEILNSNKITIFNYSHIGTEVGWLNGLQILKPSMEMRDWSKFAWKKGDVLVNGCGFMCIFKEWATDDYTKFNGCYSNSRDGYENVPNAETLKFNKVDHNIAHGYIREIEKKLGGIFNTSTLEIENSQFKDGDILVLDDDGKSHFKTILLYQSNNEDKYEVYSFLNAGTLYLSLEATLMDDRKARPATDSEKQQLFDALAKENKAWDAEKKAIVDLPKKCEFKAFDKVLCRNSKDDTWEADFFSRLTRKEIDFIASDKYLCVGDLWMYCIPYNEETAHLLGTTDDWKGGNND